MISVRGKKSLLYSNGDMKMLSTLKSGIARNDKLRPPFFVPRFAWSPCMHSSNDFPSQKCIVCNAEKFLSNFL